MAAPSVSSITRHEFSASALAEDTFRVVEFAGVETISQPYRFELSLVSNNPDIAFKEVIDQPATLTMSRGDDPCEVDGIVIDFEQGVKADVESEYRYVYRAVLAPRLWRCALSFQSRIYQNQTVEEIVGQILTDAGVDHQFELSGSYDPREFTTQYKETDLQFVQRLLEFEGIRYYFKHSGGAETMILSDDASDAPDIEGEIETPYRYQGGLVAADDRETITDFMARQQLVTAETRIKDYNYRTPEQELLSESALDTEQAVGVESDYGVHVMDAGRGDQLAKVRNEEIESTRLVMTGISLCLRFRTGQCFELTEHYRDGLNQRYLLTRIEHRGSQAGAAVAGATGEAGSGYVNEFRCVPASVPFRPPRVTPVPKLPGVLTAKVESSGGTYAPVDDQGRYRVRMPFDIGDAGDAQATKPVRLAQPYTGPGYGQHFPVHKDVEMVVACVDGNVDRVLGLSTIYNPTQFSPVTSDNASQNVLRSWGQNELTFDDKQGSEEIYMHGTKDHRVQITNDESISIGNNRSKSVGTDESLTVGQDQTETVKRDVTVSVGNDRTETVSGNETISIIKDRTETVTGNETITITKDRTETVTGNETITIVKDRTRTVEKNDTLTISDDRTKDVGKKEVITVGSTQDTTVESDVTLTSSSGKIHLTAATEIQLSTGDSLLVMKADGTITLSGKTLSISGQTEVVVGVGTQAVTLNNQKVAVSGAGITSAAIGVHEVTGAMVKIN